MAFFGRSQPVDLGLPMATPFPQPLLVAQIPGTADAGGVNAPEGRVADEFAMSVHPHRASLCTQTLCMFMRFVWCGCCGSWD